MMPNPRRVAILLGLLTILLTCGGPVLAQQADPVVEAVRKASPAVVNISAVEVVERRSTFGDPLIDDFFNDFFDFSPKRTRRSSSLGSGVILDGERGYILTNHHVVARASEVRVTLADQRELSAEVLGSDVASDLAVLKVETQTPLPTITLGDSDGLLIGQRVIAIGNSFGLSHTVTSGVVSALNRAFKVQGQLFFDFIQTDAAINPGNSGGALLDVGGNLIGINTAIYYRAQGIGFAIPINKARRVAAELIDHGRVRASWLGLSVQTLTPELGEHFSVPQGRGVIVAEVAPDSPAQASGMSRGDVITRVGQMPVASQEAFERAVADYPPGYGLSLTLFRNQEPRLLTLIAAVFPQARTTDRAFRALGFKVESVDPKQAERWGLAPGQGVVVTEIRPDSPADRIGLRPGDILLAMEEQEVNSPQEFARLVGRLDVSQPIKVIVQRKRSRYLVTLRPRG